VVSEKISPEQAARKVLVVASKVPQLSVVGIAGPGDALANAEKTFRTFELIAQQAPDLKFCLSTNGLRLPEYVDEILKYNIEHVTITINMVDAKIGQHIYPWIFFKNKRWTGIEASQILHEQQMKGLEMLSDRGILCKINSVMIPGINDNHLVEVNKAVHKRGAFLHNIMPLISAPEHGTVFGLKGTPSPSAQELKALQDRCEGRINMMRHCRQCRADAVGMLGEDFGSDFSQEKLEAIESSYDPALHRMYVEKVEGLRKEQTAAEMKGLSDLSNIDSNISILLAVATKSEGRVNQHFGHAKEFQIYEASRSGVKFIGHRRVDLYCQGGYDNEEVLPKTIRAINDCHAVLVAKIGACPREELMKVGIEPVENLAFEFIEPAAMAYFKSYLERIASGETAHQTRADAQLRQGAFVTAA
jgi:nitrogen fixation protein NifB